jgi:nucleoporin NDC1
MRSLVDGLASDGPINRIVEETTEHTKLPDLFRSIHVPRGPAALEEPKAKVQALVQAAPSSSLDISGLVTRATAQADTTIRQSVPALASVYDRLAMWWTRERVSRVAEACLPRRELDVLAIEGEGAH